MKHAWGLVRSYKAGNVLLLLRAPGFYLDMFMGILIVVAVIFNRLTRKERS